MQRRYFLGATAAAAAGLVLWRLAPADTDRVEHSSSTNSSAQNGIPTVEKSDSEWREQLSPEAYKVLRKAGTEAPGSSDLNAVKADGEFKCAGCGLELFASDTKYESGTGWPSFYDYIEGHLEFKTDYKMILPRKEYHCARCGGHQGHVFKDGPDPTGLRYCNNGVALTFVPADKSA